MMKVWEKMAEQHDQIVELEDQVKRLEKVRDSAITEIEGLRAEIADLKKERRGLKAKLAEEERAKYGWQDRYERQGGQAAVLRMELSDMKKDKAILIKVVENQMAHVCGLVDGRPCQGCEEDKERIRRSPNLKRVFFKETEETE